MPQVLSMTPKEGESPEDFAGRVGDQVNQFFGSAPADTPADTPEDTATDTSADEPAPEEEPAPSA